MVLNTLHLFAGAGGGILADLLLGHRPIGAVEIDQYARQVLLYRQADGSLPQFPVWDDVQTFRADNPDTAEYIKRLQGIRENLCISGGFPCQDISSAGKGAGITGEKSGLWKEYARIVGEIRPRYVFLENSNLLVRRGLDVVLTDLAEMGYSMAWGIVSAADVGAPHIRKRFWGVGERERVTANSGNARLQTAGRGITVEKKINDTCRLHENLSYSNGDDNRWLHRSEEQDKADERPVRRGKEKSLCRQRREIEPRLGGMADGLSDWLDENELRTLWLPDEKGIPRVASNVKNKTNRLKCLGNAQVPLQAAVAFETLREILESYDC